MPSVEGKALKRKVKLSTLAPRKKAKTRHLAVDDLPWKVALHRQEAGLNSALEGVMELEEVDGVEVFYEETDAGKVVRFRVNDEGEDLSQVDVVKRDARDTHGSTNVTEKDVEEEETIEQPFDSKSLLPDWHTFSLHTQLLRTLFVQHFNTPTPIQSKALPAIAKGKDVIGVAETGSGKTLAYGLPILHYLLTEATSRQKSHAPRARRHLRALIIAPTRELALQVSSHLNACLEPVDVSIVGVKREETDSNGILNSQPNSKNQKGSKGKAKQKETGPDTERTSIKSKGPPLVSIAAIVGGMSAQKQRRILDRGVDVMVATPGRLWDILQEDDDLANQVKSLKFLVLDEADRMIETGHFMELENILRLTLRQDKRDEIEPDPGIEEEQEYLRDEAEVKDGLQTLVFSATLSKELQRNLKKRSRPKHLKKGQPTSTLDELLMRLDFRDLEPEIIDLSPEGGVVSTLKESQIYCLSGNKDAYLYYFLLRYPGRSLIFLSSIDGIRRLMPLMELLGLRAFPLHSQLEQRQRLKNLDRFKSTPNSILFATDIAARGLDIPSVDHVIHYQIPRSADVYVHRNGRTARARRSGFSLLMCGPDERRLVRALLGSLGRQEDEIPEMSVEMYLLDKLKARIQLARQIDNTQHKIKKDNHEKNWLRKTAEAMEIELDSDFGLSSDDDDQRAIPSKKQHKSANAKTAALKAELKELLSQPLVARGVSTRYITSGSRPIVDDIIAGAHHETMVGLPKTAAGTDVVHSKRKKVKKQEEYEAWTGLSS